MPPNRGGPADMHWIIERHDVLGSTMDAADDRAKRGAPAGVVVVAAEQTSGRGQRGRTWLAPRGTSLLMTIICRPTCQPEELSVFPTHVGRYVSRAIERLTGLPCDLKVPNDVLIDNRKTAGVLCQSSVQEGRVNYVLIGIGVNVNISPEDLPLENATSLLAETGRSWDVNAVLEEVLNQLEACWCFSACQLAAD